MESTCCYASVPREIISKPEKKKKQSSSAFWTTEIHDLLLSVCRLLHQNIFSCMSSLKPPPVVAEAKRTKTQEVRSQTREHCQASCRALLPPLPRWATSESCHWCLCPADTWSLCYLQGVWIGQGPNGRVQLLGVRLTVLGERITGADKSTLGWLAHPKKSKRVKTVRSEPKWINGLRYLALERCGEREQRFLSCAFLYLSLKAGIPHPATQSFQSSPTSSVPHCQLGRKLSNGAFAELLCILCPTSTYLKSLSRVPLPTTLRYL